MFDPSQLYGLKEDDLKKEGLTQGARKKFIAEVRQVYVIYWSFNHKKVKLTLIAYVFPTRG